MNYLECSKHFSQYIVTEIMTSVSSVLVVYLFYSGDFLLSYQICK